MAGYLPSKLFVLLLFFLLYFFSAVVLPFFSHWVVTPGRSWLANRHRYREIVTGELSIVNLSSKARIGIISNQENNCDSCDSRIGFGAGGYPIGDDNTCGNWARYGGDNGDRDIKAMGYILVQWVSGQSASSSRRTMINGTYNAYRNCRLISTQLV